NASLWASFFTTTHAQRSFSASERMRSCSTLSASWLTGQMTVSRASSERRTSAKLTSSKKSMNKSVDAARQSITRRSEVSAVVNTRSISRRCSRLMNSDCGWKRLSVEFSWSLSIAQWAMPQSLRYWTKFVAKKLFPTPPLPLMMRLICLFIRRCVESEVVRVCDARTANAWSFGMRCRLLVRTDLWRSRWRFGNGSGARAWFFVSSSDNAAFLAKVSDATRNCFLAVHLGKKTRDGVDAHGYVNR